MKPGSDHILKTRSGYDLILKTESATQGRDADPNIMVDPDSVKTSGTEFQIRLKYAEFTIKKIAKLGISHFFTSLLINKYHNMFRIDPIVLRIIFMVFDICLILFDTDLAITNAYFNQK